MHAAETTTPSRGPQYYDAGPPAPRRGDAARSRPDAPAPPPAPSARLSRLALAQRQHHQGWR